MLNIIDYCIIGYLVILCLCSAYLRRDSENKLKSYLSYSFLMCASFSIIGYLCLFYLIENYEKLLVYYIIISILILIVPSLFIILKYRKNIEVQDDEEIDDEQSKN